jgi:hypothetical protein
MPVIFPTLIKQRWPKETNSALNAFYGHPLGAHGHVNPEWEVENLTKLETLWRMTEEGVHVQHLTIHRKCAASFLRVLTALWEYYGNDQELINRHHLNEWDGSFNPRSIRGSTHLSVHAYAAAVDIAAKWNPMGVHWRDDGKMLPSAAIDAFKGEGWTWGGDFLHRKDAMHFQATS